MPMSKLTLVAPATCRKYLVGRCQFKLMSLGRSCNHVMRRIPAFWRVSYTIETNCSIKSWWV